MDIDFSLSGGLHAVDPANGNTLVDTGNTLSPGFDLYINNAFPGQCIEFDPLCESYGVTPSDAYSVSGGNLVIAPQSGDTGIIGNQWLFNTVGYSGTAGVWVGRAFTGSYYSDLGWVSSTIGGSPTGTYEPIAWHFTAESMTTAAGGTLANQVEHDTAEPRFTGRILHQWSYSGGGGGEICSGGQATTTVAIANGSEYGVLFLKPADNGGTGLIQPWLNNAYDNSTFTSPQMQVTTGAGPVPACGGAVAGTYSNVYSTHAALLLDSNIGSTVTISHWRIWCKTPTSC
jgi:hypothetical protein